MMSAKKRNENQNPEEELNMKESSAMETESSSQGPEPSETGQPETELQLAAERERYLRLAAEYDNYRKRSQKERELLFADVRADTVSQMLPVFDNLDRALRTGCSDQAFFKGVEMTMNQLLDIFGRLGVKIIPAVGEKFDPQLHNAVMHVESEEHDEAVIVEEFQKGFMLGEKVIRFSMVKVAN